MPSEPLNNYIRMHRNRAALSQAELAALVCCGSAATIARYELGVREPLLDTALAFEAAFGTTARELFPGRFRKVERIVAERAELLIGEIRAEGPSPSATVRLRFLSELVKKLDAGQ